MKILIDKETVEQVVEVFGGNDWHDEIVSSQWADKANQSIAALSQALKESSDSVLREQSTEQEPVGITITGKLGNIYSFTSDYSLKKGDKVYTSPPQPQEAVLVEREACAKVLDDMADDMAREMEPSTAIAYVRSKAAAIRARGNT